MRYAVVFAPEARDDLFGIYDFVASRAGDAIALGYVERIERVCLGLATFPHRGTPRDHILPGLRVIGVEKRVSVAFVVQGTTVTILRVLHGGRDLGRALP